MLAAFKEDGTPDFDQLMKNRECYCEAVIYLTQKKEDLDAVLEAVREFSMSLNEGLSGKDGMWKLSILSSALDRI